MRAPRPDFGVSSVQRRCFHGGPSCKADAPEDELAEVAASVEVAVGMGNMRRAADNSDDDSEEDDHEGDWEDERATDEEDDEDEEAGEGVDAAAGKKAARRAAAVAKAAHIGAGRPSRILIITS